MAGWRDHCPQGGAAAPHLNTLSIQCEFFCNNKSHLLLGNARVMWPLCREMCPCHPPKYPLYSRWVFCDKIQPVSSWDTPDHMTIVPRDVPLPPTKIPSVFKVSFCDNSARLQLGNARVTWPLCRGMCCCHPPKYPPYSRWVFCNNKSHLQLGIVSVTGLLCPGMSPVSVVFKLSFSW